MILNRDNCWEGNKAGMGKRQYWGGQGQPLQGCDICAET